MHCFLIVLYSKDFDKSSTLLSLDACVPADFKLRVHIWNNGPVSLYELLELSCVISSFKRKGVDVVYTESLENRSLSEIYNEVWTNSNTIFTVLDDDTHLTHDYFCSLTLFSKSKSLVMLPKILAQGQCVYPKVKGVNDVQKLPINEVISQSIVSVMSAVSVKPELKVILNTHFSDLFDSRFCFYGIDSTFFKRLRIVGYKTFFLASPLEHSLSSTDLIEVSDFRVKERIIDSCLQMRNYPCFGSFKGFFLTVKEFGLKRVLAERHNIIISLYYGVHPRLK